MKPALLPLALLPFALLLAAAPAAAKEPVGWKKSGDRIAVPTADISFSATAAGAMLVKTAEFSRKGQGLDNIAQYESADRQLFATVYVYRPAYPDAALTAYRTDRTIRERFGGIAPLEQGVVAAPGYPGSVIRIVYPDGGTKAFNDGAPVATAAAFLRVSGWVVKLRVTAPAARRADVVAALDALIAGMRIGGRAKVYPARPLQLAAPCPGPETVAMLRPVDAKALEGTLAAAMISIAIPQSQPKDAPPPAFPANGMQPACVRGTFGYGGGSIELLQPAGSATPGTVVAALDDAGTTLVLDRSLVTSGYDLKVAQIGIANIYGSFDRVPSSAQIAELLSGKVAPGGARRASVIFAADGTNRIELVTDPAKP